MLDTPSGWLGELISSRQLLNCGIGLKTPRPSPETLQVLANQSIAVGIYFTASWCGPCKRFTPQLATFCNTVNSSPLHRTKWVNGSGHSNYDANHISSNKHTALSIVVVSCDQQEEQFDEYLKSMPSDWLAVPFQEIEARRQLMNKLRVRSVPRLVLYQGSTGQLYTEHGVESIESDREGHKFPYEKFSPPWYRSRWVMLIFRQLPMLLVFLFYTYMRPGRPNRALVVDRAEESSHIVVPPLSTLTTTRAPIQAWIQPVADEL